MSAQERWKTHWKCLSHPFSHTAARKAPKLEIHRTAPNLSLCSPDLSKGQRILFVALRNCRRADRYSKKDAGVEGFVGNWLLTTKFIIRCYKCCFRSVSQISQNLSGSIAFLFRPLFLLWPHSLLRSLLHECWHIDHQVLCVSKGLICLVCCIPWFEYDNQGAGF